MNEIVVELQVGNSDNGVGEAGERARRRSPSRASLHPLLLYREAFGRAALRESAPAHAHQADPGGLWLRGRNDPVQDRRSRHSPSEKESVYLKIIGSMIERTVPSLLKLFRTMLDT